VPGKKRIGCHKRLEFIKQSAAKDFGFHGQSYPLFVGEAKPLSFQLLFENTVLFDEIVDDRLLMAIKPACQGNYEEMERLYDVCHCTNRLSVILIDNNIIQFIRIFAPYDNPVDPYILEPHMSLTSDAPAVKALALMEQNDTSYIFVVDVGQYKGVITIQGLARMLTQLDERH